MDWQQASTKVHSLNTILALVYHSNYYVRAILGVLQGKPLDARDRFSFDHPRIDAEEAWQRMMDNTLSDAEMLANLIERLPEEQIWETFVEEKYGRHYRNFQGLIEHCHYHLGQIVLVKKILTEKNI